MPRKILFEAVVILIVFSTVSQADVYVAPDGKDSNPGNQTQPFKSLEKARDYVRDLHKAGKAGDALTVWLREGTYYRSQTFELGEEDSGTAEAPIQYRAEPGKKVWLSGGVSVPTALFSKTTAQGILARLPAEARRHVFQISLKRAGMNDWIKELPDHFGAFKPPPPFVQVYCNGLRMPWARWPNQGFDKFVEIIDPGSGLVDHEARRQKKFRPGVFKYAGERPSRWNVDRGVWILGYWARAYISEVVRAGKIDTARHEITWKVPLRYGLASWGARRWYAFNLLEELDAPGEWYLDRKKGILYFWPPKPLAQCQVVLSRLTGPLVLCDDAKDITFRDLGFEGGRSDGVVIQGGQSVHVVGCEIRNVSGNAVSLLNGRGHQVVGCDIHHVGEGGVIMRGGNRQTLEPADFLAANNHIHHLSELKRNYTPALYLDGVGMRAAHNLIHHLPHIAVLYGGNDLTMEYNDIYWCLTETSEAGVFYCGRNWTYRGNLIQYNYVHHINDQIEGSPTGCNVAHLDDCVSGNTYRGNILYRVGRGISVCGGPWNVVDNNLFIDCMLGVDLQTRGLHKWVFTRHADGTVTGTAAYARQKGTACPQLDRLKKVPWNRAPYTKYPDMANLLRDDPIGAPRWCRITRNISIGGRVMQVAPDVRPEWVTIEKNWDGLTDGDPGVAGPYRRDYRLKPGAPALAKTGFEPIPFDKIGLIHDSTRRSWPVHAEPPPSNWKPAWIIRREMEKKMPTGLPVVAVRRATARIQPDGIIQPDEWTPGEKQTVAVNPFKPELLQWDAISGEKTALPSRVWLQVDDKALYIAFDNPVDAKKGVAGGRTWGLSDAVEVALSVSAGNEPGPILLWRGYTDGYFETSDEAGAPRALLERAGEGVEYGAKVIDKGRWTAEFRLPFTAIGIEPRKRNPRLLFSLSVRKVHGNQWVTWKKTRGHSWEVRKSGMLWLEPFGNVSFGGRFPSRAYILIYALSGKKPMKMEPVTNCETATWYKPIGSCLSFTTGDLSPREWRAQSFSFIPEKDGEITLKLMGRGQRSAVDNHFIPVWTYYDAVRVKGAEIVNGGFEQMDAADNPTGWFSDIHRPLVITDARVAGEGKRCVKCWHSGRWTQNLTVKADHKVTVQFLVRGETAMSGRQKGISPINGK